MSLPSVGMIGVRRPAQRDRHSSNKTSNNIWDGGSGTRYAMRMGRAAIEAVLTRSVVHIVAAPTWSGRQICRSLFWLRRDYSEAMPVLRGSIFSSTLPRGRIAPGFEYIRGSEISEISDRHNTHLRCQIVCT